MRPRQYVKNLMFLSRSDVGKMIQVNVPWKTRLWYIIQRDVLCLHPDPPGLFVVTDVWNSGFSVEPVYHCTRCEEFVPWSLGCADEFSHLCDDCYGEALFEGKQHA